MILVLKKKSIDIIEINLKYKGNFADDARHGIGKAYYVYNRRLIYEGKLKNGMRHAVQIKIITIY